MNEYYWNLTVIGIIQGASCGTVKCEENGTRSSGATGGVSTKLSRKFRTSQMFLLHTRQESLCTECVAFGNTSRYKILRFVLREGV